MSNKITKYIAFWLGLISIGYGFHTLYLTPVIVGVGIWFYEFVID